MDKARLRSRGLQGGGVAVYGVANLEGCNIHDNTATDHGGGLFIWGTAMLTDTNVYSNTATEGPNVFVYGQQ